ncbi:3'-5' exoribonuclease YhaM family protein [Bythopirellula polymerisocia]|uniref:3'-5' exoribonuclease YhaM n=1 Tax=Bythopirellula polymerisocia TaxID=2528003 RepID=A0A5C6CVW9_9BACT|nr:HD domain-containing protein [Bythopirellula polymerisocia]TWU27824.1 3'-5' exoribonuclease YhaM [Bythopirellula polymerisocia]
MSKAQTSLFDGGDVSSSLTTLSALTNGQEADFFALLSAKEELTTKNGKPYHKVTFRDAQREVSFPIWNDTSWSTVCRDQWTVGEFYKLRALYRETDYGPQLEIRKIRPVVEADTAEGFRPEMCLPSSRFDPHEMYEELISLTKDFIEDTEISTFVQSILEEYQIILLTLPAAKYNHHAHVGGFLEHVLSVAKTCAYFADKYAELYPEMQLDKDLVIAGGILHDIGKVRELTATPAGAEYTPAGTLIGHILQGRDIIRETAEENTISDEKLLRLEHIIVAHQRLPEWGSPKAPMTPEALIVHHADDLDAKLQMMAMALEDDPAEGPFTSNRNPLRQKIYRGGEGEEA